MEPSPRPWSGDSRRAAREAGIAVVAFGHAGDGRLPIAIDPATMALMRQVRAAFDPNNIMNPGKLIDAWPRGAESPVEPAIRGAPAS